MNDKGAARKNKARPAGFTLIEVVLAVSIMAFITSVIYMSFFTTSRNVEQAEAKRDNTDLARILLTKMSDDIHNAYCGSLMTGKTVFYGKKQEQKTGGNELRTDSLYLTTLTNSRKRGSKETELCEVGYYFKEKPDGSGNVLMRHDKRELSNDIAPLEGGVEYEITDRVEELHLRYLRSGSTSFVEELGNSGPCLSGALPKAVEISLTLDDGSLYTTRVDVGNAK